MQGQTPPFKIEENKPQYKFPALSVFMGLPKIGKSTAMATMPDTLILDVEGRGYEHLAPKHLSKCSTLDLVKQGVSYFFSQENKKHKILVIDHLRKLTSLWTRSIEKEFQVDNIGAIDWGEGHTKLKTYISKFFDVLLKQLILHSDKYVIVIAHAIDRNNELRLDVDGKNESMILGLVDAVGFLDRGVDSDTITINFQYKKGVEFGCRNPFLATYNGEFEIDKLMRVAAGK